MPLGLQGIDLEPIREDAGAYTTGRAVTATLRVSPNGNNKGGSSWTKAYRTIPAALDAASTDGDDCTLILISPNTTNYDINMPGNPTWSANVVLRGPYRLWTVIRNTHSSATSIIKLTGKASLENLAMIQTGTLNGIIFTRSGYHIKNCGFSSSGLTGAATSISIDGSGATIIGGHMDNVELRGHVSYSRALHLDVATVNLIQNVNIHNCLTGIRISNAASDGNIFKNIDIGDSALAIDIDGGNEQHFDNINLHHNTIDIDDEVGDHTWSNIYGAFPIHIEPDNLVGVQVNAGAADTYGGDTQLRAAVTSTVPFRIVGVHIEPSAGEWYQLRFSADAGGTFYDILQFDATKREGIAAPSGTEFIFNEGTRISASVKSVTGGNNVKVWIEIQEI